MRMDGIPFSASRYELASCTLQQLAAEDADPISSTLAVMEPWRTLGYRTDGLARYLLRSDPALNRYSVWVCDEIAGVVGVRYPWLLGPYLELLALFDPHQGKGLGSDILSWLETEARAAAQNLWTLVSAFNTKGRAFYQRFGFVELATLTDLVKVGSDEILMRKRLDQSA
jgi:diamine N-acetyltransferase